MTKIKDFFRQELAGWKRWEAAWLITAIAVITALSLYWKDSFIGIISAVTGVACVIFTGKGKLSAYIVGLINSVLYAIIAYSAAYYGETMLNALYYVPMQFIGFYTWSKNMNDSTSEVKKRHMTAGGRLLVLFSIAASTAVYGFILKAMGDAMPFVDSFTTVSSVIAMIISVKMYAEQWWIWVGVNVFTIYMWWTSFITGQDNMATLLMWCVYLINSIVMLVKWEAEAKRQEV